MAQAMCKEVLLECTYRCGQKDECPLVSGKFAKLENAPCCDHIWIPSRFQALARAKDHIVDKQKAARLFLHELLGGS